MALNTSFIVALLVLAVSCCRAFTLTPAPAVITRGALVAAKHQGALCVSQQRHRRSCCTLSMQSGEDEDTKTTIDWDAELKKLNSKQVRGVSDTEVAVENFKKKVDAKLSSTLNNVQPIRVPNPKSVGRQLLAKDWKFWALVLAGVGFAAALSGALSREELVVLEDTHNMDRMLAAASFDFSSGGAGAAAGDAVQQLVA